MSLSFWLSNNSKEEFKGVEGTVNSDIAIIGGGMTGIMCGYMLADSGFKVSILEKNRIGSGTTGNTTAKITAGHALMYSKMCKSFGEDKAKLYLKANESAIKDIQEIIKTENIDCDFMKQKSYLYTEKYENIKALEEEYEVVEKLGGDIKLIDDKCLGRDVPFNVLKALCYNNSAKFHPIKYLNTISNIISKKGVEIYENTKVTNIINYKDDYEIVTQNGSIIAQYVILASHYPITNIPGYYFLRMYQERDYIIGIKTENKFFDDMYLSVDSPTRSFRTAKTNDGEILLIGGGEHKTGKSIPNVNEYEKLEKYANTLYPDCEVLYRWSAQDVMPVDNVPYIGKYSIHTPNMYVATGFKKWGMTTSHIAAKIITDKILEKENKYEDAFTTSRFKLAASAKRELEILKETTKALIIKNITLPKEQLEDITEEEGKVIEYEGQKIGVYKDSIGRFYGVDANCAHLGCELTFNDTEKTWDCPCHGSRFDIYGKNISEPAIYDLEKIEL